jgi:primosomal protein N' (replication factor Y)
VLLFGVTASGKTEVYLNAIARALELGRSAMVLVPEIALTAQVADVFIGRFGEKVAILHSRLSDGEKHDEWRRMQSGEARIVVGARSAVFAPLQNLGLIVLDEEHEASYKQEKEPRYNARDLAAERARLNGATLVLGSATPSLESYFASEAIRVVGAETRGEHAQILGGSGNQDGSRLDVPPAILPNAPRRAPNPSILRVEMRERIGNRPLPRVEVVDLREEFKERRALFSLRLTEAMAERLRRGEQTILFLNRRGYAQFVLCRDCGFVARCPNCAVSLAFHAYERALRCHHCDHTAPAPSLCPDCGSAKVRAFGIGTEKVEEEVLKIFPSARVARMDRDTTARKGAQGEADILIGTQMVAKGLDFPNVTLVGVVSADTAINMPDFRAAERAFQLLTQVAGRAGRGEQPGEVIVQTFSPDHYAVQAAARQDYPAFYRQEILFRQELRYPPFSRFVNMVSADAVEEQAEARAQKLTAVLERILPPEIEIIGPSPAPLARLKNLYRFHVALRAPLDAPLSELVRRALEQLTSSDRLGLQIDLDPLSMA